MESRAKLFGHAIHPILIVFPLGLLGTAVIFDIIYLIWGSGLMAAVAFWMMTAGIIGGLLAAAFRTDRLAEADRNAGKDHWCGTWHHEFVVVLLFVVSWWLRHDLPERPEMLASVLGFIGLGLALVGGWLGGELVERLGVGVDEGANLDAPNSLTTPAAEISHRSYRKQEVRS